MNTKLRIIRPSGRENKDYSECQTKELARLGFDIEETTTKYNSDWPYSSSSISERVSEFESAMMCEYTHIIFCARGGYGASDILPHIDWELLKYAKNKLLIGFSDISAIHSAIYSKLNLNSQNIRLIHGPMPFTELWSFNSTETKTLVQTCKGQRISYQIPLIPLNTLTTTDITCEGLLFGGCLSVLTNLIGTENLPNLDNHILFFEDIAEHPAQVIRNLNQWQQSGVIKNVKAIIWGCFSKPGEGLRDNPEILFNEISARLQIPMMHSKSFGHIINNSPISIGTKGVIENNQLSYFLEK